MSSYNLSQMLAPFEVLIAGILLGFISLLAEIKRGKGMKKCEIKRDKGIKKHYTVTSGLLSGRQDGKMTSDNLNQ